MMVIAYGHVSHDLIPRKLWYKLSAYEWRWTDCNHIGQCRDVLFHSSVQLVWQRKQLRNGINSSTKIDHTTWHGSRGWYGNDNQMTPLKTCYCISFTNVWKTLSTRIRGKSTLTDFISHTKVVLKLGVQGAAAGETTGQSPSKPLSIYKRKPGHEFV